MGNFRQWWQTNDVDIKERSRRHNLNSETMLELLRCVRRPAICPYLHWNLLRYWRTSPMTTVTAFGNVRRRAILELVLVLGRVSITTPTSGGKS
jgi:hypothetical protein